MHNIVIQINAAANIHLEYFAIDKIANVTKYKIGIYNTFALLAVGILVHSNPNNSVIKAITKTLVMLYSLFLSFCRFG